MSLTILLAIIRPWINTEVIRDSIGLPAVIKLALI